MGLQVAYSLSQGQFQDEQGLQVSQQLKSLLAVQTRAPRQEVQTFRCCAEQEMKEGLVLRFYARTRR